MNIFLLEDDESQAFGIKTYLENNNYLVAHASSLKKAESIFNYQFDLLLLDVNLADGSGFDFIEMFDIKNIPIIFLTVNDSEKDIVKGLNNSDGYMTKPFKLSILEAQIKSVLKRVDGLEKKINYKTIILNGESYTCVIDGKDVRLSVKEFELLKLLIINKGNIVTREKIFEVIWDIDGDFIEDNSLTVCMKRLRKKLGSYSFAIETVRGIGYRFVRF